MAKHTHTRVRALKPLFADGDPEVMRHFIRLVVAYEDLRIETQGILINDIEPMDLVSRDYRQLYFVRRGLASVLEVEQAVHALNKSTAFKEIKKTFARKSAKVWAEAVSFFATHHEALNSRRGHYSGHFSNQAADAVVDTLVKSPTAQGVLDILKRPGENTEQRVFRFAWQFVSSGMAVDRGDESIESFIPKVFTLIVEAMTHATNAVAVIGEEYIFPRFGSVRK